MLGEDLINRGAEVGVLRENFGVAIRVHHVPACQRLVIIEMQTSKFSKWVISIDLLNVFLNFIILLLVLEDACH